MLEISLTKLTQGETEAVGSLVTAARTQGFFALTLDGDEGESVIRDDLFLTEFANKILDSPTAVKAEYDFRKLNRFRTLGFKPLGSEEGAQKGKPDGFEMFMLPQNELLLPSIDRSLPGPSLVTAAIDILSRCMRSHENISQMLLRRLSEGLNLGDSIIAAHCTQEPSVTNIGLLRYPPQPKGTSNFGHIAHTDVGSLTMIRSTERGLQVIDSESGDWTFVAPSDRQVLVQFGDCLKFLSHGAIVPSVHRVVPSDIAPEATKITVAYFVRPNEKAKIQTDDGTVWAYEDYHCRKFDAFARPLGIRPDGEDTLISIRRYAQEV